MVVVAKKTSPAQNLESLAAELRALAIKHVEIGRQLALMADRMERGDSPGSAPAGLRHVKEALDRLIAPILRGEGDYEG